MDFVEIRRKFLKFFEKRGHTIVSSSPLIPSDPSVLFTTAGMQQFKPYFLGEKSPWGPNVTSVQKCIRTSDIDEVGDERHLTFFEMLGNFSFGGYWKKEAIQLAWEFLGEILSKNSKSEIRNPKQVLNSNVQNAKLFVTVFAGDAEVPADEESYKIWRDEIGIPEELIKKCGREDNFWGPTGAEGPCGPATEIYINGTEVWNLVFNEYYCDKDKKLTPLQQKGVDTGMGLERLAMVLQDKKNIFETDLFVPLQSLLPPDTHPVASRRTLDHARATAFLLGDGIRPSNKEAGYVLRRLIRKIVLYESRYKFSDDALRDMLSVVVHEYGDFYNELKENQNAISETFIDEQHKFRKLVDRGREQIRKFIEDREEQPKFAKRVREDFGSRSEDYINLISGTEAFDIYQTYGFPSELIEDELEQYGYSYHKEEFQRAFEEAQRKHQEISRAGLEKKFGGHGLVLDTGELKAANEEEVKKATRLHTATHLLQAALRQVLGPEVRQRGSDITAERTRFDFTFPRKMTGEELKQVEQLVQEKVNEGLQVIMQEMDFGKAVSRGALTVPGARYPEKVKVYGINGFSKEVCGGPHVQRTGEVGNFRIIKEESVAAGIRRIRAVVD